MTACWPVAHRFGHGIGLIPNAIAAQIPAPLPQRKSEHPRQAQKILGFVTFDFHSVRRGEIAICTTLTPPANALRAATGRVSDLPFLRGVAIAHIQPQNTILVQHPVDVSENLDQILDEQIRVWL